MDNLPWGYRIVPTVGGRRIDLDWRSRRRITAADYPPPPVVVNTAARADGVMKLANRG